MIVVTGATGTLGHAIALKLLDLMPADQIGVSVRDPSKATDLASLGIRVRRGDFTDPAGLPAAFDSATQVLLVSSNASASGGDPIAQHRAAIVAAKTAGVKRIVYTSHMAASARSAFAPMLDHAMTEDMLRESGLAWTALRHGFYAASGIALMGNVAETGVIEAPADGKVSWTAHADLAEAAAVILTQPGRYNGPTPPLTGSEALDLEDMATIASGLLGRAIARKVITDADLRAKIAERGIPGRAAEIAVGLYAASRNGEFAVVNPTLEQLLGRRPTSMRERIADKLGAIAASKVSSAASTSLR